MKRLLPAVIVTAFHALPAQAHLVASGFGPLYDGMGHFLLSPEDCLPAMALGLLAGLCGARSARIGIFVLCAAWFLAALAGLLVVHVTARVSTHGTCLILLVLGGTLAADWRGAKLVILPLAVVLGCTRGLADMEGVVASLPSIVGACGMVAGVFVFFALSASLTLTDGQPWIRIVARIAGSWVASMGLLLAGWVWRYGITV